MLLRNIIIFLLFLINTIFCEIEYQKNIDEKCSVNLQCLSGCCQKDKCVETKKCKTFRNTIYIVVAIVCVVLAAIFAIYLWVNLCLIKKEFIKKAVDIAEAKKEAEEKKEKYNKEKNN